MSTKPILSISVREVVAFVLQTGDLGGTGHFVSSTRALDGTRGHQRLQKTRPAGYEAEIPIVFRVEDPDFTLEIKGRIDGIWTRDGSVLIEEIKTVQRLWTGPADPLHLAQAKIYAFVYAREHGLAECEIQVTYVELESGQTVEFCERHTLQTLDQFFQRVIGEYLEWIREHRAWCRLRDQSIQQLAFPFPAWREGQRSLAVAVYRAAKNRARLFAEAPTGIGKTVSVLFPAAKAMGEGRVEKIFYLTAKTVGRTVAEKAMADLRSAGLRLRAVTLTARDKICFNNGQPCDVRACPFALGYYDRIKPAVRDALQNEAFTRPQIELIARRHQVCPFELSLDISLWADAIICDYNYAFDPSASLKRYFGDERRDFALLIDEAHNLIDRAREMFSADLERSELVALKSTIEDHIPACAKALSKIAARLSSLHKDDGWVERDGTLVSKAAPARIAKPLEHFRVEAELWLVQNQPSAFREALLDVYFRVVAFQRTLELYGEPYVTLYEKEAGRLRLFCVDPSTLIREALQRTGSAIFFSATLRPGDFFRDALGGEPLDPFLALASPFPPENLRVLVQDQIPTALRARAQSYDAIAASIGALVARRTGNYLVYFPSYDYLQQVLDRFRRLHPEIRTEAQTTGMTEPQRDTFLAQFRSAPDETLVAFAVMGGIFGEGIDLIGERLIGVAIVGVGLPQLCLERDLIRESCQARNGQRGALSGFDYAYTYPGMNRVLQAVGRVIRSQTDRGVVLLIDERFRKRPYRRLLPGWWRPEWVRSPEEIRAAVQRFWTPDAEALGEEETTRNGEDLLKSGDSCLNEKR